MYLLLHVYNDSPVVTILLGMNDTDLLSHCLQIPGRLVNPLTPPGRRVTT